MDERFAAYWARAEEMDKWDSLKSFREQFGNVKIGKTVCLA